MVNALGLCEHNNMGSSCPSCIRGKSMRGMGADACPTGFYRLKVLGIDTGQCLPTSGTLVTGAQSGAAGTVATGIATNPSNQAAALNAAQTMGVNTIVEKIKAHPIATASIVGVIAILALNGMGIVRVPFLKR